MKNNNLNNLIKFIRKFQYFEENEIKIKADYPEYEFGDSFQEIFKYEINKESYKYLLSKFLEWNSDFMDELAQMKSEENNLSFDYSSIYIEFINYFDKNSEEYLVSQAGYIMLNYDSDSVDPGYCNQISEEIANKGRLDILHIYAESYLCMMAGEDYNYLNFLIQEHRANVDPTFPERLVMILESDYIDPDFIPEESPSYEDDDEAF